MYSLVALCWGLVWLEADSYLDLGGEKTKRKLSSFPIKCRTFLSILQQHSWPSFLKKKTLGLLLCIEKVERSVGGLCFLKVEIVWEMCDFCSGVRDSKLWSLFIKITQKTRNMDTTQMKPGF